MPVPYKNVTEQFALLYEALCKDKTKVLECVEAAQSMLKVFNASSQTRQHAFGCEEYDMTELCRFLSMMTVTGGMHARILKFILSALYIALPIRFHVFRHVDGDDTTNTLVKSIFNSFHMCLTRNTDIMRSLASFHILREHLTKLNA